jgi:hypothetical protein
MRLEQEIRSLGIAFGLLVEGLLTIQNVTRTVATQLFWTTGLDVTAN